MGRTPAAPDRFHWLRCHLRWRCSCVWRKGSGHRGQQTRRRRHHQRGRPSWFRWGSGSRSGTSGLEDDREVLRAVRSPPGFVLRPQAAPEGQEWAPPDRAPTHGSADHGPERWQSSLGWSPTRHGCATSSMPRLLQLGILETTGPQADLFLQRWPQLWPCLLSLTIGRRSSVVARARLEAVPFWGCCFLWLAPSLRPCWFLGPLAVQPKRHFFFVPLGVEL